ncbi:MAG: hypothetical protein L0Y36_03470 [Planctomycetales bacterium]|nr:hypothetical protein [Planctomycetales bacterium]
MNLVKWIRKNNRKIMVFVVIFCMVSFVIGSFGIKILVSVLGGGGNQLIGAYDGGKIKTRQFLQAQSELAVLQMLMADRMLLAQSGRGLGGPLLGHLLFGDSQFGGDIAATLKQAAQNGRINLTVEDVERYFNQPRQRPEIVWILLREEAYRAGYILPTASAAETLRMAIPAMTGGQIDAAGLVNSVIAKNNLSEEQILRVFADMMGVVSYAAAVTDSQDVTINQIKAFLGRSKERIDADFVEIAAADFVDPNAAVSDEQLQQQFEAYKNARANIPTDQNPFGFGYQLGRRVQMEYVAVKLDDVKTLTEKPSTEAIETYYSRNISQFQNTRPSDPNNPESEKITETQPFAEVEELIRRRLENERTLSQANLIFNDVKSQTEAGFETLNLDEATAEQIQKAAADFQAVTKTLSEKYGIAVTAGKTGWFGAETFADDEVLNSLSIQRQRDSLRLADLAMAVTNEKPERPQIGMPAIRVWENIGPLLGGYYARGEAQYHGVMAMVRIIGIQDAQTPANMDVEFGTHGFALFKNQPETAAFRLKDTVKKDLLLSNAMETAKTRAAELARRIEEKGWDEGMAAYNAVYAKTPADPNQSAGTGAVEMGTLRQQLRIGAADIETAKRIMLESPASAQFIQRRLVGNMLTNRLYALLPEDAESTGTIQTLLAFEPTATCYVVKSVVRQPAAEKDYLDNKAQTALQLNAMQSAGLPLVHFDTANILKRMGYKAEITQEEMESKTRPEEMPVPDEVL